MNTDNSNSDVDPVERDKMMTQQQEKILNEVLQKVTEVHAVIEGRGGIHDRIELLEKKADEIMLFKAKTLGMMAVVSVIASVLSHKLTSLMIMP